MNVQASPRTLLRFLLGVILALSVINLLLLVSKHVLGHGSLLGLVRLFDVDRESNIPAYFSALQLGLAALVLFVLGRNRLAAGDPYRTHWLGLAAVFAYLSVDEAAMIHETMIGDALRANLVLSGVWYYAWYIVYGILVLGFAALYWRFFRALPARVRMRFAIAAALFLTGAVGFEMLGSYLFGLQHLEPATRELLLALEAAVEEPLEMIGIAYFVYAVLDHAAACGVSTRIEICPERAPQAAPSSSRA